MTADGASLATTIILLLPMLYFLVATPTFLLRSFDDPIVTRLLRSLFSAHFAIVAATCALAALAFAVAARPIVAIGIGVIAALAIGARHWFLRRMDDGIRARDAGDTAATRRLRHLHLGAMLYNAVQFVAIVAGIPIVFPTTA